MSSGIVRALREGRHLEAARLLHAVVDRLRPAHPDLRHGLMLLGQVYLVAGLPAQARPHLQAALELADRDGDPIAQAIVGDLGLVYLDLDLPGPATPLLRRWLADVERRHGAASAETAAPRDHLATACAAIGRVDEAVELLLANLALCQRCFGPEHEYTLAARATLAELAPRSNSAVRIASFLANLTGQQR